MGRRRDFGLGKAQVAKRGQNSRSSSKTRLPSWIDFLCFGRRVIDQENAEDIETRAVAAAAAAAAAFFLQPRRPRLWLWITYSSCLFWWWGSCEQMITCGSLQLRRAPPT